MFFLVLSGIFWLILTLNESYEREIKVTMQIKGIPKDSFISVSAISTVKASKKALMKRYNYGSKRQNKE